MKTQKYIECGCCSQYHRTDYTGDCRNDAERFTWFRLIAIGIDGDQIVELDHEEDEDNET